MNHRIRKGAARKLDKSRIESFMPGGKPRIRVNIFYLKQVEEPLFFVGIRVSIGLIFYVKH